MQPRAGQTCTDPSTDPTVPSAAAKTPPQTSAVYGPRRVAHPILRNHHVLCLYYVRKGGAGHAHRCLPPGGRPLRGQR